MHHLEIKMLIQYNLNCFPPTLQVCERFSFFFPGPFKWISVMHGCRHQGSMNTFAHEKWRWGRGGGESISLAMSHWLHCFIRFPGSRGFTSAILPHREEWRRWKSMSPGHTHRSKLESRQHGEETRAGCVGGCAWVMRGFVMVCIVNCNSPVGIQLTETSDQAEEPKEIQRYLWSWAFLSFLTFHFIHYTW